MSDSDQTSTNRTANLLAMIGMAIGESAYRNFEGGCGGGPRRIVSRPCHRKNVSAGRCAADGRWAGPRKCCRTHGGLVVGVSRISSRQCILPNGEGAGRDRYIGCAACQSCGGRSVASACKGDGSGRSACSGTRNRQCD
jgi:hypothetical protein